MKPKTVETEDEFNARIDAEDKLARTVTCDLNTCLGSVGETCTTEAGAPRIRHCARLMKAQRATGMRATIAKSRPQNLRDVRVGRV